jgi:hydantoinase/carbamoylase family amidase
MAKVKVKGSRLLKTLNSLSKIGRCPGGGITRTTFSQADLEARNYVCNLMREAGLHVRMDPYANIVGSYEGSCGTGMVLCGSHIDTVPNGGPLDGSYGVLAGIEVMRAIVEKGIRTRNGIEVVAFTEEEGVRFPTFLGSRGFTRALSKEHIYSLRDRNGVSFRQALADAGYNQDELLPAHRRLDEIKAYLELHIEQGPVLEKERIPIGVVKSIVGTGELTVQINGHASHAGTPMTLRSDALAGASRIVLGVNEIARKRVNTVATVGALNVLPNASNTVPGSVTFPIDFRAPTATDLKTLRDEIISLSKKVAKQNDLEVTITLRSYNRPALMSSAVIQTISSCSKALHMPYKIMHSGAGHDCQNMAAVTKTGMIFVPCTGGVSHTPKESASPANLEAGANVLLATLLRLADA